MLWDRGFLGSDTPQKLRNTIVWIFGLNFDLRAGQEHRNLRMTNSQITLKEDINGKYLEYMEDVFKTNSWGLAHKNLKRNVCRAYENPECLLRCLVALYNLHFSHCPPVPLDDDGFTYGLF